jgi:hypothetical protein
LKNAPICRSTPAASTNTLSSAHESQIVARQTSPLLLCVANLRRFRIPSTDFSGSIRTFPRASSTVTIAPVCNSRSYLRSAPTIHIFKVRREHILGSHVDDASAACLRESQQRSKVEIVREDDVAMFPRPHHDDVVLGARVADI